MKPPTAVFELPSSGMQNTDEKKKLLAYSWLSSLRDYVLIDSRDLYVWHLSRDDANHVWMLRVNANRGEDILLKSIDARLSVADIYGRVEFSGRN